LDAACPPLERSEVDTGFERDRHDSRSERVYLALMRAYPQEVRRRYADEMVRYFGDLCREERMSRGRIGVALLWARTLPELLFTALEERGNLLQRNAYLPMAPRTVARWGALCALLGGSLGVAYHLINYSLLGTLNILTGDYSYGNNPFIIYIMLSLFLYALSLSSLGLFGLYGTIVARTGRPGLVAGAGAVFSTGAAVLWLATSGYAAINRLALGSAFFAPFEWVWNLGTFVIPKAILFWFLGLLLLGIAAARQPLPIRLRVLPLALFALILPSYLLGSHFETVGNPVTGVIVMGFTQSLPFAGVTLLGWVLLKDYDGEPLAVPSGPAESARATHGMAEAVSRATSRAREARSGTSGEKAVKEKELLEALRRRGALTAAGVALETSLSVEEADRMLSALAAQGHLELRVEHGRLLYSFWESEG
jgi:hypothetical protein